MAALGVSLLMTSCIKEIDPQSSTITSDQAANAPGAFDNYVTAITNSLAGSFGYSGSSSSAYDFGYPTFFLTRDVMGQDIAVESSSSEWFTTWYGCGTGLGPQYAVCQMPWTYYYGWIKSCNEVITMAGENPESDKVSGAGIAYAMRAMFYMDLARMFAPQTYAKNKQAETVPMVVETTSVADLATNPRATNEVMWAQILSDLDKAEEYLADYKRSDVYTPDLSVVYGLKARAYLTMEDWANAQLYAKKAQTGYTAMSQSQYLSRTDGFNTPNSSWMFGLTYKDTDENILENDADTSWGSQMIIEVSESGCGYASNYGAPKRIDYHLYETIPATDYRKQCFVDFAIDDMADYDEVVDALSEYSDAPEGLIATAEGTTSGVVGGLELKFRPKNGVHANQYQAFTVAVPLMRVEEMMLIEAEAAGMQNEAEGIRLLTAFAQLRDANYEYGTHQSDSYDSSYATQFQNEVWWQRRVELWGEGFATFDIKRLDKKVIRSYEGTNHPSGYRWNSDVYKTNNGNNYPEWMDWCIVQSETNYNASCTNNPTPTKPSADSSEHKW
jgi:hypothetical protein